MSALRERVAEAYAGYYGFLGSDGWDDMSGADRQRCREVADTILPVIREALVNDEAARKAGALAAFRAKTSGAPATVVASHVGEAMFDALAEQRQAD